MGKVVHRQVIDGHLTVTQTRRTKEDGLHVESIVYAGETAEGEPVAEWVFPIQLRYALGDAAELAVRQTKFPAPSATDKDVHTEHCCSAHGCKYGETTCPVATRAKPQSFPCEECGTEDGDGGPRPLAVIAAEIRADWKKVYYGAEPYLEAMGRLDKITDSYGDEPGWKMVVYFLSNASTWRGETARRIKAELNAMTP